MPPHLVNTVFRKESKRKVNVVTGGAGFVGSHLVDALIARGEACAVVDDLSTGAIDNLSPAIETGHCTFVYGDLIECAGRLPRMLRESGCAPIHRIYHLASPASPEAYEADQWGTLAINGIVTMRLIEFALEEGASFLFSSTSEIYGDPLVHPQPETYFGNVDPIGPRSCYDEGKRFGEAAVAAAVRSKALEGKIVRLFNCYGPRMQVGDGRLIPAALEAFGSGEPFPIQGTGRQTRSMTFIRDAIEAIVMVAESPDLVLRPVNIGNDDERSVEDIVRAFASVAGVPFVPRYLLARPGDPQRRKPDLTFARSCGWAPATTLEDGLRETIAWYRAESPALAAAT